MVTGPSYSDPRRVPAGAAAILRRGEDLAWPMLLRTGAHGAGTWGPPGGWVAPREDPLDAVVREVWEEVGLNLTPGGFAFIGYSHSVFPEGVECVTLWFETLLGSEAAARVRNTYPARATDLVWATHDDMPTPLFQGFRDVLAKGLIR